MSRPVVFSWKNKKGWTNQTTFLVSTRTQMLLINSPLLVFHMGDLDLHLLSTCGPCLLPLAFHHYCKALKAQKHTQEHWLDSKNISPCSYYLSVNLNIEVFKVIFSSIYSNSFLCIPVLRLKKKKFSKWLDCICYLPVQWNLHAFSWKDSFPKRKQVLFLVGPMLVEMRSANPTSGALGIMMRWVSLTFWFPDLRTPKQNAIYWSLLSTGILGQFVTTKNPVIMHSCCYYFFTVKCIFLASDNLYGILNWHIRHSTNNGVALLLSAQERQIYIWNIYLFC